MRSSSRWRSVLAGAVAGALALAVNLLAVFGSGMTEPVQSDAMYFKDFAVNLAAGRGYVAELSFWPGKPSMQRMPGWPFVVSLGLRTFPAESPDAVVRVTGAVVNAFAAMGIGLLAVFVSRRSIAGWVAGAAYAVHPSGLLAVTSGLSEPLFILLVSFGTLCGLAGIRRIRQASAGWRGSGPVLCVAGSLLLGVACLVRAGFVVLPVGFAAVLAAAAASGGAPRRPLRRWVRALPFFLAVLAAFALPTAAWIARNWAVSGHVPVISTLRGQTLYGGNNPVVANDLEFWGYWVFPDRIPGETPLVDLARTRSECEVDGYYFVKGVEYARRNWKAMPRLLLGKAVRAYVPVPWKASPGSYAVSGFRWILYLGTVAGAIVVMRRVRPRPWGYGVVLAAMLLTNATSVLVFWGCARFAFELEPFLLPVAAAACMRWRR